MNDTSGLICVSPAPARGFPVADYRLLLLFERIGTAAVFDLLAAALTERKVSKRKEEGEKKL